MQSRIIFPKIQAKTRSSSNLVQPPMYIDKISGYPRYHTRKVAKQFAKQVPVRHTPCPKIAVFAIPAYQAAQGCYAPRKSAIQAPSKNQKT